MVNLSALTDETLVSMYVKVIMKRSILCSTDTKARFSHTFLIL